MMGIYALTNHKGGVGKSMSATTQLSRNRPHSFQRQDTNAECFD
jgi:hypothetical protein